MGIIFTRGDGGLSNVGNKLFIWDESEDTFALVSADIDGNGNDPSINHLNNFAPLSISDSKATKGVFSSDTTVGGDMSINGSLTVGGMAVTSTEIGLLDGISTIGVSQNEKVLTQNSDGVVTIGQSNANQVLNIASHDGVDGGLKLNNELVLSSAAELNKLNGTVDGTVSQNKAVIADANKDIAGINNLSISSINIGGDDLVVPVSQLNKLNNVVDGVAKEQAVLVTDANKDISGLRNLINSGNLSTGTLDVAGNMLAKSSTGAELNLNTSSNDIQINNKLGGINFQAPDESSGVDAVTVAASIKVISEGEFTSTNNATKLVFSTGSSGTATEKLVINSQGNVEVSSGDLTVNGNQTVTQDLTVGAKLTIGATAVTGATIAALDNITLGQSQNDKVVTQSSNGVVNIGEESGNQVLNIASHDGVDGGLKLNGLLVKSSAVELNKLNNVSEGTVTESKVYYCRW